MKHRGRKPRMRPITVRFKAFWDVPFDRNEQSFREYDVEDGLTDEECALKTGRDGSYWL